MTITIHSLLKCCQSTATLDCTKRRVVMHMYILTDARFNIIVELSILHSDDNILRHPIAAVAVG